MLSMMIWSLSVAKGVGPKVAGIANESDFFRYANSRLTFVIRTCSVQWLVGSFVSLGGLVTTAVCQIINDKIWWNPQDLMLVMMGSRADL
jgi:NCS1 family nucleobase:cation symporter-1